MVFSNAFLITLLAAFFLLLLCLVLLGKLLRTKQKFAEMADALDEMAAGHSNIKLLACQSDLTAPLAYKINAITQAYENRIISMKRVDDANKQLMTSLSHDVRTPLTTLIGYLDAIHRGIAVGDERDAYMETARKKAYDLKDYIDVLFDWFKLNSNDLALTMTTIEATEFTRDLLKDWVPVFEEHRMEYDVDFPQGPCPIRVDETGYARVVNNLIQNAIVHSHADHIEISMKRSPKTLSVCVTDNGVGIGKEDLPHIFERLYKCDKGRSEKGSGLGLSITRQMVEQMGGQIVAASAPKETTRFTVIFPLSI